MQESKPAPDSSSAFEDWVMPPENQNDLLRGIKTLGRYGRLLMPAVRGPSTFFEAALVMFVVLAGSYLFSPHDPLFLYSGFPYAWIVPMILALRYGSLVGIFGMLLLLASWFLFYAGMDPFTSLLVEQAAFPRLFFLGGFLVVLIAGQFDDVWMSRLAHANAINSYFNERLSVLTHNHFLLRLSHDRLEKDLLVKPTTLRDTWLQLRQIAINHVDSNEPLPGAVELLHLAAQACQLDTAAVYVVKGKQISDAPVARVGLPFQLNREDVLVKLCIAKRTLVHLQMSELKQGTGSDYIVGVPLFSGNQKLIGIMLIKHMPFLSLSYENLQFLRVLMGYYADGVHHVDVVQKVLQAMPTCPPEFALDYMRLIRLQKEAGVDSSILALCFGPHQMQDVLSAHVVHNVRALDVVWSMRSGENVIVMVLIPLSGDNSVMGYLLRMEESIKRLFGLTFDQAFISAQSVKLNPNDDERVMLNLLSGLAAQNGKVRE